MYDSPEERKDGDEKVSEEQPLMKDAKEKLKYTDENDDNNPRVYPFHYNTSSELERFSIFREVLEVVFMIILVIVLLPLLLVAFICFVVSSLCWRKVGTTFAFRRTKFNEHVMQRVLSSVGHYVPPWYYNNHLGTCIPFGATPGLTFEREVYYQSDGSRFAVDWYPECPTSPLSPSSPPSSSSSSSSTPRTIILYLCGLGLSSDANVAQQFAKQISILRRSECTTTGIIVPRGHPTSRLKWTTARAWHGDLTEDLKLVLAELYEHYKQKDEQVRVLITGFSASSNIVAMALADLSESNPEYFQDYNSNSSSNSEEEYKHPMIIAAAMLVAANYDYESSMISLEKTLVGGIYSRLLVMGFKEFLKENSHMHGEIPNIDELMNCRFLSEYDQAAYKTLNGFESVASYYYRLSPKRILKKIKCRMITMVGHDDPLYLYSHGSVRKGIDLEHYTENENIIFIEPSHGNHFGFYNGSFFEMFTNDVSYMYPPQIASTLLDCVYESKPFSNIDSNDRYTNTNSIEGDVEDQLPLEDVEDGHFVICEKFQTDK